jgi:Mg/Co/Ni transporter MgtE
MQDKKVPYKMTIDEIVFLRDATRFSESSDLVSRLSRDQRKLLAETLQDLIVKHSSQAVNSTITLELHLLDDEAVAEIKRLYEESKPKPEHIARCVFCNHPVKQCVCDQWASYRQ